MEQFTVPNGVATIWNIFHFPNSLLVPINIYPTFAKVMKTCSSSC